MYSLHVIMDSSARKRHSLVVKCFYSFITIICVFWFVILATLNNDKQYQLVSLLLSHILVAFEIEHDRLWNSELIDLLKTTFCYEITTVTKIYYVE